VDDDGDSDYSTVSGSDADSDSEVNVESGVQMASSGFEMILPTGSRAGHRSLARYYKQKTHIPREVAAPHVQVLMLEYQARGWPTAEARTPVERKQLKLEQQHRARTSIKLQLKANKLYRHIHISTADC